MIRLINGLMSHPPLPLLPPCEIKEGTSTNLESEIWHLTSSKHGAFAGSASVAILLPGDSAVMPCNAAAASHGAALGFG